MTDKEYITEWSSEKSKNQLLKKKRKTQPLNEEAKPKDIKSPISIELQDAYKYSKEEMLELLQEKENQSNFALSYLPMSHCYDKSYMHKEFVDRINCSPSTDYIFTTSIDGVLKFWKKKYIGIEFVKQFKAHPGKITGLSITNNGLFLVTCSIKDEYLKIFDIINFDMINFIKISFTPFICEYISKENSENMLIAVSEKDSGKIYILDTNKIGGDKVIKTISIHNSPISCMKYNTIYNAVLTTDI